MNWKNIIQVAVANAAVAISIDKIYDYKQKCKNKITDFILEELGNSLTDEEIKNIKVILYDNRK